MNATHWLKLAAIAAFAYVLYDFIPSPLPDIPNNVQQVILPALVCWVLFSGNATLYNRRAERDRRRRRSVDDEPTVILAPPPVVGRVIVVDRRDSRLDGYDKGWVDGLAARSVRDGGRRVLPFRE